MEYRHSFPRPRRIDRGDLGSSARDQSARTLSAGARVCSTLACAQGRTHCDIASVAGRFPTGSSIAYAVSKAGLIHLTHCLAVALAPDIAVNCIAPGLVEGTQMAQRLPEEMAQKARRQAVLGRTASAADIAAQTVLFCRTDSISGQVISIDGGMPGSMH